ncbi:MAG TPA: tyrosine-type recombinase/integrase [Methylomirabilota bacterium]|nr:tyrosine-type recombinase/integrase [Methylomirabilota bacterium]
MKQRFGLVRRPWGVFYLKDKITGNQVALKTSDRTEALKLLNARNDSESQPAMNLSLARVYLNGADPKLSTRTWQEVMEHIVSQKTDETKRRWEVAIKDANFNGIRKLAVAETRAEHFYKALEDAKVSTNVYLRRIHNHALGMDWLLKSVIPRLQWPKPVFQQKRAITAAEDVKIVERETNPERLDFYELLWHTGASQSDAAFLLAEDIDWNTRTICYSRKKLKGRGGSVKPALIRFGAEVEAILKRRPKSGPLFPYLCTVRPGDRATEFKQRCIGLKIEKVSLHCYRYAWAERALKCGYPERFAQQALGHNSKAVHHAYARHAEVTVPSLDDWEKSFRTGTGEMPKPKLVPVNFHAQMPEPSVTEATPQLAKAG